MNGCEPPGESAVRNIANSSDRPSRAGADAPALVIVDFTDAEMWRNAELFCNAHLTFCFGCDPDKTRIG